MLLELLFPKKSVVCARGTDLDEALQMARSLLPFAPFSEKYKTYSEFSKEQGYLVHLKISSHKIDYSSNGSINGTIEVYGAGDSLEKALSDAHLQRRGVISSSNEISNQEMQIEQMYTTTIEYSLKRQARKELQNRVRIAPLSEPKTIIGLGKAPLEALENARLLLPFGSAELLFRKYYEYEPEMHKRLVIHDGKEKFFIEYLAKITYQLSQKGALRLEQSKKDPSFQSLSLLASIDKEKKDIN